MFGFTTQGFWSTKLINNKPALLSVNLYFVFYISYSIFCILYFIFLIVIKATNVSLNRCLASPLTTRGFCSSELIISGHAATQTQIYSYRMIYITKIHNIHTSNTFVNIWYTMCSEYMIYNVHSCILHILYYDTTEYSIFDICKPASGNYRSWTRPASNWASQKANIWNDAKYIFDLFVYII